MKRILRLFPMLMFACIACTQINQPGSHETAENLLVEPDFASAAEAAQAATSADPQLARAAVAHLRAMGPAGLDALRTLHAHEVAYRLGEGPGPGLDATDSARVLAAIDAVSGQHDGWASGLYWHQEMHTALAQARETGKPVLNLHLLGRLDDEFC